MSGSRVAMHGRNHRPDGSDPIPSLAAIVAVEILAGDGTTSVAEGDGNEELMPWAHIDGASLVNLSTNTNPTVVADGFYMVFAGVEVSSGMAAGAGYDMSLSVNGALLQFGSSPVGSSASATMPSDTTPGISPTFAAAANYMTAGDEITVSVRNLNNTASAILFRILTAQIIQFTSPVIS